MVKLTRPAQNKVFGSSALSAELTVFGGSTPSTNIDDILNSTEAERGWGTVGANGFPPMEWFNALGYALSYYSAYIMQSGIPAWTSLQNYYVNSYAVGSDGKLYRSKTGINGTPNVGNNPVGDTTNWESAFDMAGLIHSSTAKTPPVDADLMGIVDSSASNVLKKLSFANLWAWIVTKSASAFLSTPSSAPTTNYQVANKKYVDDIFSGNPSISVYRSGSTQAVSNGTATKVQFNSKEFDTTNAYDNSTNFRFTPQKAGRYRINATILFATLTTDTSQLYVYKNGIPYKKGASVKNNVYAVSVDCKVDMNGSTDYIEIYVNHTGGTGVYFGSELSYFQADLIIGA